MSRMSLGAGLMLGASVVVLCATGAVAGELKAASRIDSVTVYPSGATVARIADVALPAGPTTLVLDDLPAELEADSLKVEGPGAQPFAIASVETRMVPADDISNPARQSLVDEVQSIDDKIEAISDRLDALDGRKKFLEHLIDSAPNGFGKALAEGTGNIDQWNQAAATIGNGLADVADAIRAANIEQRALTKEREAKEKMLADLPAPRDHTAVRISLQADAATSGTLTVRYHTASARWLPTYDAQLTTGDRGGSPSLALVRRAEVTQSTGENWDGVHLTLSTAQSQGGTAAPELDPYLVSLYDPDNTVASDSVAPSAPATGLANKLQRFSGSAAGEAEAAPALAKVIEAAADFGDFRAEYNVPGLVSVEDSEGARSLQIATERLQPKLGVRAAPAVSETAYLHASFTAPDGAPLLAGKVALFRDGTFVGNGQVEFTEAGADVDLGFGVDERVHIARATLDHRTGDAGIPIIASRKTDTRSYKTTVANLHSQPMEITIMDRTPYAEDSDINVKRLSISTAPTRENVDDKRGILAWTYTYGPGETRDIVNAYEVSWPANQSLVSLD
ncbi:MAG TPA: mucoidy inhibitor MuiA family protein [Bauldia sp.]|nr:mucoidy inhibitor MuiA family protein [Bauldia sp.]